MNNRITITIIIVILFFLIFKTKQNNNKEKKIYEPPNIEYGILTDTFVVKKGVTQKNQVLGEILYLHHIT